MSSNYVKQPSQTNRLSNLAQAIMPKQDLASYWLLVSQPNVDH